MQCALLPCAVLATTSNGSIVMQKKWNPVADSRAIVVSGNARFTVLTPAMIRMEWSPIGAFEDRASLVFVNRRLPVPEFTADKADGRLTIRTAAITLRYTEGSGPFSKANLAIELTLNGQPVVWQPGLENRGNLGGTCRTLDMVSGDVPLPPGLLSRDGWVVVDDSRRLLFDDHPETGRPWATPRDRKDALDWYFFGHGHDYQRALGDFTRVAGRVPLPPRFVWGTWWSRYWPYSDTELKRLVKAFKAHDVPLDVLVIDMDWHLKGWTGYTWNPKYFPDPDKFLKWVRDQGLRATLNLHPADGVKKHEQAFPAVARAMNLDPETADQVSFDCTDPRYVEAYFKYLHHPLERQGVDFWWIDWQQGERTNIAGLDPLWWLNYLHWADMERNPERVGKRPMMFSRWGGLGNHRYQIGFSGDTYCNWVSLAFQPYFTTTAGNVCYPYWSHDIGGHQPGPVEPELYARWIQWGAFSPILRTHTTRNPKAERRIWKFPDEVFQAARKAFHLRYELIPYIYTAARQCYDTGLPLCRPLYYDWPELDEAYEYTGEYLFGDDLLVAPVTKPANPMSGCAEVHVWLPPGEWTNWFTGRTYEGPRRILLQVPLDEIPLFARAGAIIPAQPKMNRTSERPVNPLILHIWPGKSGSTRVYEDDNETVDYQTGACIWTPVSHKLIDGVRHITIGPVEGSYSGMPKERAYEIHFHHIPALRAVRVNGKAMEYQEHLSLPGWSYDPRACSNIIRLPRQAVGTKVEIAVEPGGAEAQVRFPNGARGRMQTTEEVLNLLAKSSQWPAIKEQLLQHTAAGADPGAPRALTPGNIIAVIPQVTLDPPIRRRALSRLLGLIVEVTARGQKPQSDALTVWATISLSPLVDQMGTATAEFTLLPPPNWTIAGEHHWDLQELEDDVPIHLATTLMPIASPQTTALESRFTLKPDGLGLDIPGRQVLLPSINRWWVAGPFPAKPPGRLDKVFPPEERIDLAATYETTNGKQVRWKKIEREMTPKTDLAGEFFVNLIEVFPRDHNDVVAYALTYLRAPEETEASLAFGTDDGVAMWLNGEEIHRHEIGRAYQSKEDRIPIRLKEGTNALLLKISQGGGGWGFCVHVETLDGQPLTSVTAHLTP